MPLGLTRLEASVRAMVCASRLKRPSGGEVETVFTPRTQRRADPIEALPPLASRLVPRRLVGPR
jgi:hypothetical protein